MSNFLIFKAAFNNSATPAIGTYTAEGATAQFNLNASISPDYYLFNTADDTAVQWFVPTAETTDFEFVADILTRQWTNRVTYFIIADSTGTTRLRMWSVNDNWHFENSDSIATTGDPEYIGVVNPITSGGFGVFHRFRVRVRKLTASSSSVEVYVDGTLKITATAGAALITCAKIGFVGGVSTFGPGVGAGIKNAYVYDLSGGDVIDRGVLSGAFNRFISWAKGIFATRDNVVLRSGGGLMTGSSLGRVDDTGVFQVCGGQTGADGGSISLTGKNRGVLDGAVELTAYDGVNSTGVQILPAGTMTVQYPDTTVKNVAMAEDVVPRSGGTVLTGTEFFKSVTHSQLQIGAGTSTTTGSCLVMYGSSFDSEELAGAFRLRARTTASYDLLGYPSGTLTWNGIYIHPATTGTCYLGVSSKRWKEIWCSQSSLNSSSDKRLKQQIAEIDDKLLDAWENVEPSKYKFNDAVETKGKTARYHFGYIAQDIQSVLEKSGVNASEYGFFLYDSWEEQKEVSHEETYTEEVKTKSGETQTITKTQKVIDIPYQAKGDSYGLRYTECLVVECKYLRRCIARLTARIEELEKGNNTK